MLVLFLLVVISLEFIQIQDQLQDFFTNMLCMLWFCCKVHKILSTLYQFCFNSSIIVATWSYVFKTLWYDSDAYVKINLRSSKIDGYDAIFLSTHKFLGGPGTPGILLMCKALYQLGSSPPSTCGGGTVNYVNAFNEKIHFLSIFCTYKCQKDTWFGLLAIKILIFFPKGIGVGYSQIKFLTPCLFRIWSQVIS